MLVAKVHDQNDQPVPNVDVQLTLSAVENSGGHHHGDDTLVLRTGTLAPVDSGAVLTQNGQVLSGNTGAAGLRFVYVAPRVGGDIKIIATCLRCTAQGPNQVWVGIRGLVKVGTSDDYELIGRTTSHPENHFLTATAYERLRILASLYRQFLVPLFPETEFDLRLRLNDASLVRGGVFDIRNGWNTPHVEHCRGAAIDIRANDAPGAIPSGLRRLFEHFAETVGADPFWDIPKVNGVPRFDLRHYHVRLMGQEDIQCP